MKKIFKKALIISCILALTLPSANAFAQVSSVKRVSGNSRYETAIKLSNTYFADTSKVTFAIVASGETYPDALIGGSLAAQESAPVLLTYKSSVPAGLVSELKRLQPDHIFLLGGPNTITDTVLTSLKKQTGIAIDRIYGNDRIQTGDEINALRATLAGMDEADFEKISDPTLFACVNAYNFHDSLYSAPYYGIMTSDQGIGFLSLAPSTIYEKNIDFGEAIGDIKVVRDGTNSMIITKGSDRYESSVKIAEKYTNELNLNPDTVILTSGENYPDGLGASSLVGLYEAPILLTQKDVLSTYVKNYISKHKIKNVIIVGGPNSVSDNLVSQIKAIK